MGKFEELNAALNEANRVVADWTKTITSIAAQREAANRALAAAQTVREQHALMAAIGDMDAVAAAKRARSDQRDAEEVLADLAIALPKAEQQLAAARKAVELAQHALGRHQATSLMQERLKSSERIDDIIGALAAELAVHEKLGRDILAVPGIIPANIHGMTSALVEQIIGDRRLRAALPAGFIRRHFPTAVSDEQRPMRLADSELQVLAPLSLTGLTDKAEQRDAA